MNLEDTHKCLSGVGGYIEITRFGPNASDKNMSRLNVKDWLEEYICKLVSADM